MARTEHPTDGRTRQNGTTNVVPLRPRQWLDSKDELVPIGAVQRDEGTDAADVAPPSPPDDGHASTWLGTGEQTIPIAPTVPAAPDFWGEDAADLQHAMEAPGPEPPENPAVSARRHELRRFALPLPTILEWLRKPPVLGAIGVLALAVIVAAVGAFGSAAPRAAHRATSKAQVIAHSTASLQHRDTPRPTRARHRPATHARVQGGRRPLSTRTRVRRGHRSAATSTANTKPPAEAAVGSGVPTTSGTVTPSVATSANPPTRAGPSGTVSLIGAGTSPSG